MWRHRTIRPFLLWFRNWRLFAGQCVCMCDSVNVYNYIFQSSLICVLICYLWQLLCECVGVCVCWPGLEWIHFCAYAPFTRVFNDCCVYACVRVYDDVRTKTTKYQMTTKQTDYQINYNLYYSLTYASSVSNLVRLSQKIGIVHFPITIRSSCCSLHVLNFHM